MNFHDKKEIPPKYIYLFLTMICFILLFLSVIFESRFSLLKTVTSAVITPMQSGINTVGSSIYNKVANQKEKDALISQNKELSNKLDEYSAQIKVYEQESYELKRLQGLLALQKQYTDYKTIGARVIATDSTNWFSVFIINKGTDDGVQVGCNILAGNGLAGIVTEAGKNYAKVRAIIDDNSNVSANVSGTKTLCTISGDLTAIDDGYINVGYINKSDTIEDGAELVTSHVSDKFLPGLLIGYITEVEMDANNLTKSAKCIPAVDFNNLQEVLVILDLKADYHTNSTDKNIYDSLTDQEDSSEKDGDTSQTKSATEDNKRQSDSSEEGSSTSEEDNPSSEDENDPGPDNNEDHEENNPNNGD